MNSCLNSPPISVPLSQGGGLKGSSRLFVRPGLNALSLGSSRFMIAGFSAPPSAMEMAADGPEGRQKVRRMLLLLLPALF